MLNHNLLKTAKIKQLSALVAAGTDGNLVGLTEIDTQGYLGCMIIVHIGVVVAGGLINTRVKNSATAGSYGAGTIDRIGSDLTSSADTDAGKMIIHDICEPLRRYITAYYQRTVANVTINGVTVILYNPADAPPAADSTVVTSQVLNGPTPSTT